MARRPAQNARELNLVPIMNLVSILIPFLLVAAQFVNLAVIDSSLPAINKDEITTPIPEDVRRVRIAITATKLAVLGADDLLGIEDTGGLDIPMDGEVYDTDELTRVLGLVKDEEPNLEDIVLVPDGTVEYEELIDVMDAARAESMTEGGRLLFPNVVIAGGAL